MPCGKELSWGNAPFHQGDSPFVLTALFVAAAGTPAVHAQAAPEAATAAPAPSSPKPESSPSGQEPVVLPSAGMPANVPTSIKALLNVTPQAPQSYAAFMHNAQLQTGLINLIRKDDDLYLDLGPEDFKKTFIFAPSLASGLGAGTFAGRLYDPMLVQFQRIGHRIFWITPNTDFASPQGRQPKRSRFRLQLRSLRSHRSWLRML